MSISGLELRTEVKELEIHQLKPLNMLMPAFVSQAYIHTATFSTNYSIMMYFLHDCWIQPLTFISLDQRVPVGVTSHPYVSELQVPFFFKWAIDGLSVDPTGSLPVAGAIIALTPPAMLVMYGVARASAAFCNELRNAVFAKVRYFKVHFFVHFAVGNMAP